MHRLGLPKLDRHQLNILIAQVKRPFTTGIQDHIDVLEPVPAGLIRGIKVNISIVVLDKPVGPGLEEAFLLDNALLVDGELLII
jgi:hypothetical protein